MFCSEPIESVYERKYYGEKGLDWPNSVLCLTESFEYHTTKGNWLVFQTEHFVITLGYDGVQIYNSLDSFCDTEELDPLFGIDGWTTTEETLFVGERITDVNSSENHWIVTFDHFQLHLYGHSADIDVSRYNHNRKWVPLAAGSHLLKRRCSCGAEGEILPDSLWDYVARCRVCHACTWAGPCLTDAIEEWNDGCTPIHLDTPEERFFAKAKDHPILYIALEKRSLWHATEQSCETNCAVIAFMDEYFTVESCNGMHGEPTFDFGHYSKYNKSMYSHKITPRSGNIRFLKANDSLGSCLYFLMDNTILSLAPFDSWLILALTESDPDGKITHPLDRDKLF